MCVNEEPEIQKVVRRSGCRRTVAISQVGKEGLAPQRSCPAGVLVPPSRPERSLRLLCCRLDISNCHSTLGYVAYLPDFVMLNPKCLMNCSEGFGVERPWD